MISVAMATYNGESYLHEQVESILRQIGKDGELVVSDDGSADSTITILAGFRDFRIRVFRNPYPRNLIKNFENALAMTRGNFIFLADQDDIWCENKVSLVLDLLNQYDCVVHNAEIRSADLSSAKGELFTIHSGRAGFFRNLIRNSYTGCCMAFKRGILEKALPFPPGIPMHDSWIGLVAEKFGTPFFMDAPLILYRSHGRNVSETGTGKSKQTFFKMARDRFFLMKGILQRR
jgi:glycosyltransferase involved in cell wall biosynthesis